MLATTEDQLKITHVYQRYTGSSAAGAVARHGIALEVVKLPKAKRGFVLLPLGWVV